MDKQVIVIAPASTYDILKQNSKNITLLKSKPNVNLNSKISASISINEYKKIISKMDTKFKHLIIPKASFDINLNDINFQNINQMINDLKCKIYLLWTWNMIF